MDPERLKPRDLDQVREEIRGEIERWMAQHERRDTERFSELLAGQQSLQRGMDEMNGRVGRINAEIGYGLPEPEERGDRQTLRVRLHALENEELVAKAIHDSYSRTFGRWQKFTLYAFAAAAAVEGFLRLVGIGS